MGGIHRPSPPVVYRVNFRGLEGAKSWAGHRFPAWLISVANHEIEAAASALCRRY